MHRKTCNDSFEIRNRGIPKSNNRRNLHRCSVRTLALGKDDLTRQLKSRGVDAFIHSKAKDKSYPLYSEDKYINT